jgi:GntR family transcriptional repressor for pyruvate dehydrogenase complex
METGGAMSRGPETAMYTTVARGTLGERVARQILTLIRSEELVPEDQLPPERELATLLGVSRPVVREALRALSIMGVIEIRQGSGTFVTSLEPRQLISHLDFVFSRDRSALLKTLEARRVVEAANARLAAERVTDEQLADLHDLVLRLRASVDDETKFRLLDIEFHTALCHAADNFLLEQFMKIADTLGEVSREKTGAFPAVRRKLLGSLETLLDALEAHDADRAEAAIVEHLDEVESVLRASDHRKPSPGVGDS